MKATRGDTATRLCSLIFALSISSVAVASAQEVAGNLHGRVLDSAGSPVEGAAITIEGTGLPRRRSTETGPDGIFRVPGLLGGSYTARIRRIGFRPVVVDDIPVRLGRTTQLEPVRLETTAIELDPIVITAERSILDPTSSAIGANLTADTYADLPVDRNYLSLLPLLPQVNESFLIDGPNIGGSTGFENVYYIDGANVTDPFGTQSNPNLPYNFIQEVRVKQGGYQAEFGRALGGIVDVVTPSGGDEFRGSLFGFFTNATLGGSPRRGVFDAETEGILDFDAGGSVEGPIVRRRLWFYAAYNVNVQGKDVQIPGLSFENARRTSHMFAGKVTWQSGENTDVVLSVFGDPTSERAISHPFVAQFGAPVALANADPFLKDANQGGITASVRARSMLSRHLLMEGTIARYQRYGEDVAATTLGHTEALFIDQGTQIWEGGFGLHSERRSVRTSARVAATLFLGAHALKGGVEYEENTADVLQAISSPQTSRSVGLVLDPGPAPVFVGLFHENDSRGRNRVPTVYLQDSWRVTDRLTINAGLRWESQYFIGAADSVGQAIANQFQPRLGFIVEPGVLGSQKIFGSFGRYYQQLPLNVPSTTFTVTQNCSYVFLADPRDPTVNPIEPCPDTLAVPAHPKKNGIDGEHFDEFILGYERRLGIGVRVGARAIHRALREAYGFGVDPAAGFILGNIGKGELDFLPRPRRDYTALEVTVERTRSGPLQFLASYVISRAHGNYTGLFASDANFPVPSNNVSLQLVEQVENSTGLLPNDRTHVVKLFGSYQFDFGLTTGSSFSLMSGTPLNEFQVGPLLPPRPLFTVERGSAGRTPMLWDWDVRLSYDLSWLWPSARYSRVILDIRNIGSPRHAAVLDQFRVVGVDPQSGEQILSQTFGQPLVHQSPMSLRLGFEMGL